MKKCIWKNTALIALLLCMLLQVVAYGEVDKLTITQIIQKQNYVWLYVSATQEDGIPATDTLAADSFSIRTNQNFAVSIRDVALASELEEGVAYTFCVDVSGSVTNAETEQICRSISAFVSSMRSVDYARIITIGSEITQLCEFTQDHSVLENAISKIDNKSQKTYLYQGLSYALESTRKNIDGVPERAAIIVFTDGMDDSDGTIGDDEILSDIADVRIPLYVVGMQGNDKSANLSAVGRIARQSGGVLYSYSDMSIGEAVTQIRETIQRTYVFLVEPESSAYGQQNIFWKASYSSSGYTISSANYVYSLTMEGVDLSTPEPEPTPTNTPEPTATPIVTVEPEPEPTDVIEEEEGSISILEWGLNFVKENLYIVIAALIVLVALILILVLVLGRKRTTTNQKQQKYEDSSEGLTMPFDDENSKTEESTFGVLNGADDEATIDGLAGIIRSEDNEETLDGSENIGVLVQFIIGFEGHEETVEKRIRDKIVLGRGDCDVDVVLGSQSESRRSTSRKHAAIINRPDGLYIKDLGARNKTFVNGMEVIGEMPLKDEDMLKLGNATVKIKILNY